MNSLVAHRFAHPVASVAIVGAGLVGTTTAHALLVSGTASEIVLVGLFLNTPGTGLIINISSPGRFAANESGGSSRRSGGARSGRITGQLIGVGSNIEYDA